MLFETPALFRGDHVPPLVRDASAKHRGETFANAYATEGLMAKVNGAHGKHLALPLWQQVAWHIGYQSSGNPKIQSEAEWFSTHSPMISFSTEREIAWYFADRTCKKKFEACGLRDATHFMWRLNPIRVYEIQSGVFGFTYTASTKNVDRFRKQNVRDFQCGDSSALNSALSATIIHAYVASQPSHHKALLIEPVAYLSSDEGSKVDAETRKLALERASRWKEWLLYPQDPMPDGRGFTGRFMLNDSLDIEVLARTVTPSR